VHDAHASVLTSLGSSALSCSSVGPERALRAIFLKRKLTIVIMPPRKSPRSPPRIATRGRLFQVIPRARRAMHSRVENTSPVENFRWEAAAPVYEKNLAAPALPAHFKRAGSVLRIHHTPHAGPSQRTRTPARGACRGFVRGIVLKMFLRSADFARCKGVGEAHYVFYSFWFARFSAPR
jgi:hypothetical protein